MGGVTDNITVVPIGAESASVEGVKQSFREFRGEEAECFMPEDRHKLLAVIEASFGDFSMFDQLVRDVFKENLRDSLSDPSVSTTRPTTAIEVV